MSVILEAIKENYGTEQEITAWDIHKITKINFKVVQMNLKRMYAREVLYCNLKYGIYQLWTDEQILERRKKVNNDIDKYDLKQKKYKIL